MVYRCACVFFPSKIRPHSYQAVSSQGGIGFTQVGGAGYPRRPQLQVHDSKHNVCGYSSAAPFPRPHSHTPGVTPPSRTCPRSQPTPLARSEGVRAAACAGTSMPPLFSIVLRLITMRWLMAPWNAVGALVPLGHPLPCGRGSHGCSSCRRLTGKSSASRPRRCHVVTDKANR